MTHSKNKVDWCLKKASVQLREEYQYGTALSLKEDIYEELSQLAKQVLSKTKIIMEQ